MIVNPYLIFIIIVLAGGWISSWVIETLNVKHASADLPAEFDGYYDADKYAKSQEYLSANTRFALVESAVFTVIQLAFILSGGFNAADRLASRFGFGEILTGLIFTGMVLSAYALLKIPFSAYQTFVIEEKFGFNKTTLKTFILDMVKTWLLAALLGGAVFSLVLWFFIRAGGSAWLYCWIAVAVFELFVAFIAPVVIMPLFNKFIPLEDGELKTEINEFAKRNDFRLSGVFKMDGSKRSSKANAFFTGFGKFKRIALFDTLIARHTVDELVSVLAHEIGHYKKQHILKSLAVSFLTSGLMFFVLSKFLGNASLFAAFGMEKISVYAGIVFFGFLFAPISAVISVAGNILSRKWEYEADRYAVEKHGKPEAFINALKKLSVENLSNLTPHPLKVFMDYSHPPVLDRIQRIKAFTSS